jgi:hypothetical protein
VIQQYGFSFRILAEKPIWLFYGASSRLGARIFVECQYMFIPLPKTAIAAINAANCK